MRQLEGPSPLRPFPLSFALEQSMSKHWDRLTLNLPPGTAEPHFLGRVQEQLEATAGVKTAFLSAHTEMLYVVFDAHELDASHLRQLVDQILGSKQNPETPVLQRSNRT